MAGDCEVCRGAGTIRLPLYRAMSLPPFAREVAAESITETVRSFPCPQCAGLVKRERLSYYKEFSALDERFDHAGYVEAVKRDMVHAMAMKLLKDGFIDFEVKRTWDGQRYIRATMAAVRPKDAKKEVPEVECSPSERKLTVDDLVQWANHTPGFREDLLQDLVDAHLCVLAELRRRA